MKISTLFTGIGLFAAQATSIPTWPASTDEIEGLMVQLWGYKRKSFADGVSPCSFSAAGPGRIAAAEWLRTAFHDMATGNVYLGTGGMDASIMFETARSENVGAAFATTLTSMLPFYNSRASMADLLALAVYAATRSCGGPVVPIRGGRIDATTAGSIGVPEPQNDIGTFKNQFDRTGFTVSDMIAMTACGHTVGGVHSADFPLILPAGTATNDYEAADSSIAVFDNKIAAEYIAGNSTDPMLVGPAVANNQASDLKVFAADGNATMQTLTDPAVFTTTCASILQRMIDVVPKTVTLTDPIQVYEAKPQELQLTLLDGGSTISFTGEVRVRTTVRPQSQIASLQLQYKDRNGGNDCGACLIMAQAQGEGTGFDDIFWFYSFSTTLPVATSVSSFIIAIYSTSGDAEMYDNNGGGFPIQDSVIFQKPQSCLNDGGLTVTAAVRSSLGSAGNLDLTLQSPRANVVVPALQTSSLTMTKQATVGLYDIYTIIYSLDSSQHVVAKFDVSTGSGTGKLADTFKAVSDLAATCGNLGGSTTSSSSSVIATTSTITSSSSSSSPSSVTSLSSSSSSSTRTSTTPTSSSPVATAPSGWTYLGCYSDSVSARALSTNVGIDGGPPAMSHKGCADACHAAGYLYSGTEYAGECWGGNTIDNGQGAAADGESLCNMPCDGNTNEICGGANRLTLYRYEG